MKKFKNTILLLTLLNIGFGSPVFAMKNNSNPEPQKLIIEPEQQNNYLACAAAILAASLSVTSAIAGPKLSNGTPISSSQDAAVVIARTIIFATISAAIVKLYNVMQHLKHTKRQAKLKEQEELNNKIQELEKAIRALTETQEEQKKDIETQLEKNTETQNQNIEKMKTELSTVVQECQKILPRIHNTNIQCCKELEDYVQIVAQLHQELNLSREELLASENLNKELKVILQKLEERVLELEQNCSTEPNSPR